MAKVSSNGSEEHVCLCRVDKTLSIQAQKVKVDERTDQNPRQLILLGSYVYLTKKQINL